MANKLYIEQLEIERQNKEIFNRIINTVPADAFIEFYKTHNRAETMAFYGIRTSKQLVKILKYFNYDFSKSKHLNKGKPSARSHESYVLAGQKSSETQKIHWANKSEEEKLAWAKKQSIAHSNSTYSAQKAIDNKLYRVSLSKEENDPRPTITFKTLLEQYNLQFSREYCLDKKFFDFNVNNILVEIDPTFTHNSTYTPFTYNTPLDKNYHKLKSEIANRHGFRCIHVFDWDDPVKIINLLANQQKIIYARTCKIAEVDKDTCDNFLIQNHLQGTARASIKIGLFYNDELVSVMTFGKPRYNKNYQYELVRYCSTAKVVGGAEKLFKYFITTYNVTSVISYCDLSKFNGETYDKLGFTLLKSPTPSKHWYNIKTKEHYTDNLLRQQGFSRLIHHCDASEDNLLTSNNRDLMISAGFIEVYDCGQATYVCNIKN